MHHKLFPILAAAGIIASFAFICPKSNAQELQNDARHSISVGAEGGWMWHQQSGSFKSICGCGVYQSGKGNNGFGGLSVEFELDKYLRFGLKFGLDSKSTTSSYSAKDTSFTVFDNDTKISTVNLTHFMQGDISVTYLFVAPTVSITPFGFGFFIELSPEFGSLSNSNITSKRVLKNPIILSNGDTVRDARFQNGTLEEELENGPVRDVNKLRIALLFSAGYDIRFANNFSIVPEASYNLPLTNVAGSASSTDWKISSFGFGLGIKYRFD